MAILNSLWAFVCAIAPLLLVWAFIGHLAWVRALRRETQGYWPFLATPLLREILLAMVLAWVAGPLIWYVEIKEAGLDGRR